MSDRVVCLNCEMLVRRLKGLLSRNHHLDHQLKKTQSRLAAVEQELKELRQAKRPTASNSSLAPSANPIGAPSPVVKKPTGRKSGAQVGHKGVSRTLLPKEQVDDFVSHRPAVCRHCQAIMDQQAPGEVVGRHQIAELPPRAVVITEHQSLACRCGRCGQVTRGIIPAALQASAIGPRLGAAIGLLGASLKGSRRDIALTLEEVLGCPIALGSVLAREKELAEALAGSYEQLVEAAGQAKVKYVDETGWKLKGKSRWLFVSADEDQVIFRIEKARTRAGFKALLGGKINGIFCTDRAGIYDMLSSKRRGLCWAHLKRDFTAAEERGGAGQAAAIKMSAVCREMFELWHRFTDGELSRAALGQAIDPLKKRMHQALEEGAACGQKKAAGLCRALLKREAALWRFASTPGLDPTNNLAERMLRPAVIWRKKSFGSSSNTGCRYVERMLSVIQTLRMRGHSTLTYLSDAITAHRNGQVTAAIQPKARTDQITGQIGLEQELRKIA